MALQVTYEEARKLSAKELERLGRGELWTTSEADEELEVPEGTTAVWVSRKHIVPAVTVAGVRYYWSDDLYDRETTRKQTQKRNTRGRFEAKTPRP